MNEICEDISYLIHFPCFFALGAYIFTIFFVRISISKVNLFGFTERTNQIHINHIPLVDINIVRSPRIGQGGLMDGSD